MMNAQTGQWMTRHEHIQRFNPQPRVAADAGPRSRADCAVVSIHSRAWRLTLKQYGHLSVVIVSIHSRAWRLTTRFTA